MKKLSFIFLALALLVMLAADSAYGQIGGVTLKGDIPFAFTVVDKTVPAGTYALKEVLHSVLVMMSTDNRENVVFFTNGVEAKGNQEVEPKLVFRRYGDQYFLAQIWTGGTRLGRELPKSAKERLVAQNQPEPQLIYIAAK